MKKVTVSPAPHVFSPVDTRYMMKSVIIALLPALLAALYFFRLPALLIILTSVAGCVASEYLLRKVRGKKPDLGDNSAALTGLLLAMVLPPATPLWMVLLASVFAIGIGKEVFGGLGHNVFNPALLARAFLMAAFPVTMTTWNAPVSLDAMTSATPLGLAKFEHVTTSYVDLFAGNVGGCIGETSSLALLAGGIYLLYKKVIDYRIPAAYIGVVVLFSGIMHILNGKVYPDPLFHVLAGGLLIGAFYMATDPVTSPVTKKGRWIFGAGCGLITMIIRYWGGLPEGVMYSILLMNAVTPLINRLARPPRFGTKGGWG